ncbi:hypothetical protein HYR99_32225 [Candidatus Poribacteria bacterium]|nr:hypothetical protein [Candidatus Poribacteria bacterium]
MVTWIPERFLGTYQQNGQPIDKVKIEFGEVWVTAVPELKKICREHRFASKKDIELRLEQLLGLPPNSRTNPQNKKEYFVEMWVKPDDLFRPCPDSEIDDHQCELGEAKGDFEVRDGKPFVEWFTESQKADYLQSNPDMMNAWFPWTRLGYTYDWGNPVNEVGLSEFVIKSSKSKDISVKVKSVMRTANYCMVP